MIAYETNAASALSMAELYLGSDEEAMKQIPLTQNKVSIISDDCFDRLSQFTWHFNRRLGYAIGERFEGGKRIRVSMHREVMNAQDGSEVDHINGDKLDNRRENLRLCTKSQNMSNRGKQLNNTTGYKGVFTSQRTTKFRAQIRVKGKSIHLGLFENLKDAAISYNIAATKYFGEFAKLNEV